MTACVDATFWSGFDDVAVEADWEVVSFLRPDPFEARRATRDLGLGMVGTISVRH